MINKLKLIKLIAITAVVLTIAATIFFVFVAFNNFNNNIVKEVFPQKTNISIASNLYVVFTKRIPTVNQKEVVFYSSPKINYLLTWSDNNTRLTITPKEGLSPTTNYSVGIRYLGKDYPWTFETSTVNNLTEKEKNYLQEQSDNESNALIESFYNKYPWYSKLPPVNEKYYINFDAIKKEFYISLYISSTSSLSQAEQESAYKAEVLKTLTSLGINTNAFTITWLIRQTN